MISRLEILARAQDSEEAARSWTVVSVFWSYLCVPDLGALMRRARRADAGDGRLCPRLPGTGGPLSAVNNERAAGFRQKKSGRGRRRQGRA